MKLKRFSADEGDNGKIKLSRGKGEKRNEKIAVIGSGPSGLSCAYQLSKLGYNVTVFESEKVTGGMLTLGIPEYRLPRASVKRDIKRITDTGVKIKTGITVGKDLSLDELKKQGFKAIYIGIGVWKERMLSIPGIKLPQVMSSLAFLKAANTGAIKKTPRGFVFGSGKQAVSFTGKRVAVIGGGNAAMDAARTALRMGTSEVNVIYRRTKDVMTAIEDEIQDAMEEGIKFHFLLNPIGIREDAGKVAALECSRMNLGEFDLSGRRIAVESSDTITIPADFVIMAIGSTPVADGISHAVAFTKEQTLKVNPLTLASDTEGIFAGGDAVNGGATVVDAIADGEKAAISIDRYLRGEDLFKDRFVVRGTRKFVDYINPGEEVKQSRRPPEQKINVRISLACFDEVIKGYSKKDALCEADRCLRCDRLETEVRS